jgi:hypothetical protein
MTCNEECYRRVALKMNLSVKEVKEVVDHFLSYTQQRMKEGAFHGVRFPYLGSIQPRLDFIQIWFDKYEGRKNEDKNTGGE